jgi:hypothetical protein
VDCDCIYKDFITSSSPEVIRAMLATRSLLNLSVSETETLKMHITTQFLVQLSKYIFYLLIYSQVVFLAHSLQ